MWLTIVVPVYNVKQYLGTCLDSLVETVRQGGGGIEVLLIDDGSTDGSGQLADEYASRHDFIHVQHKANGGVAAARNDGLSAGKGEWVWFVDSDDWVEPGNILRMQKCAAAHRDADVLLFDAWQEGKTQAPWEHFETGQLWTEKKEIEKLRNGVLYFPLNIPKTSVPLSALWDRLYRRDFLMQNNLLFQTELKVLDDMVFNVEVFGAAKKIDYQKLPIYHYRFVADSITHQFNPGRQRENEKVFRYLETQNVDRQALYCREIKSFGISCLLQFFHQGNSLSIMKKLQEVRSCLKSPSYREAFSKVNIRNLEWRLIILTLLGRIRCDFGIYLLSVAQQSAVHHNKTT